jgi:hypothetical protein
MASTISIPRAIAGFVSGSVVALSTMVFLAWPFWQYVLFIGASIASIVILILGVPIFLLLRRERLLNVYFSILLGGLFSVAVPAGTIIFNALLGSGPSEGYFKLAFEALLLFFLPGAVGGLAGWLVAAGWRVRAS